MDCNAYIGVTCHAKRVLSDPSTPLESDPSKYWLLQRFHPNSQLHTNQKLFLNLNENFPHILPEFELPNKAHLWLVHFCHKKNAFTQRGRCKQGQKKKKNQK